MKQEKPPNKVDQCTCGGKINLQKSQKETERKIQSQADLKAILMEQCD
jgi:hypothetical protein